MVVRFVTRMVSSLVNKNKFTLNRYKEIREECKKRGFNVSDCESNWNTNECIQYMGDYTPTQEDKDILIERIELRIKESPKKYWHYNSKRITKEEAIELLYKCK